VDGLYRVPPTTAEPPRDAGIVGEVIGQFADPFAFYRELVQNAIDAGTPSVEVIVEREADGEVVRASVRDAGEGMTREIVEDQLLVLFRSTKENDDSKIGKFGIGFASVLAPAPNVVVVHTSRDGRRLTLHLQRDLSYELFDAGPATRTGTTVELEIPLATSFEAFVTASRTALVRWCRHAMVPVHFVVREAGTAVEESRIDRPLALDHALVQLRAVSEDGHTTAVVGITEDAAQYAGFFDHGLTLHEDLESPIRGVAFKVQDARLGHTISRDNVRRDDAYDRAVELVRDVAKHQLPAAIANTLAAAADAGDRARYLAVSRALRAADVAVPRAQWTFPLIAPVDGKRAAVADTLGTCPRAARRTSAITAMLAAAGVPVADVGPNGELDDELQRVLGPPVDVHGELTLVRPVATTDIDDALLTLISELIDRAHKRPAGLALAELDGAFGAFLAITGSAGDAMLAPAAEGDAWLIDRRRAGRKPFGRLSRAPVVLNARHAQVAAARALAPSDPIAAASMLARLLLLVAGVLDIERSERLFAATLDAHAIGDAR
jgi:molecular chaperone HtpG